MMTDSSARFTEEELLSFVQGAAPAELAARIEQATGEDRQLAAEIAMMRTLKPAIALSTGGMNPPGEMDWRRLETEIARETSRPTQIQAPPSRGGRLVMWQAAAALFALVAVGQAAYMTTQQTGTEPGYQTATGGIAAHVLAISFTANTTEADLRALLLASGARLVDGPAASGLYRVSFATPDALEEGRRLLEASPAIDAVLDQ